MTKKFIDGVAIDLTVEEENLLNERLEQHNANVFNRALNKLRNKRNNLLAETDYFALSDVSMSEEMTQYRKDLRDITNGLTTVEQVEAVEFPTKPSGE
nr:hypothetical protein [uncultured Mediterranean phage uvMED]